MFREFASYAESGSEEWHAIRSHGLGGSEVSTLFGLNPYKSPFTLWQEKVNGYRQPTVYAEAAEWGHLLEPIVAAKFANAHPEYEVVETKKTFQHQTEDWALANVDRMLYSEDKGWGILEVKTANQYTSDKWAHGQTPPNYYIQVQHYMSVMGLDWAYIVVLIGGQKYEERYIERDDETINNILAAGSHFWNYHVVNQIAPEVDGHDSTTGTLKEMYRESVAGSVLELGEEFSGIFLLIEEYEAQIEVLGGLVDECKNRVKVRMGTTERATCGTVTVTWKTAKNGQRRFLVK